MNSSCNLSFPYPEVKVEKRNNKTAKMLNNIIFSSTGELYTISDYTFQSIITAETDPYLSDILDCISITEMKHFKILIKTLFLLGSAPSLILSNKRSTNQHQYGANFDINSIIKQNTENERRSVRLYKQFINAIDDKYIKRTIERIILDEEHHIKIFSSLTK